MKVKDVLVLQEAVDDLNEGKAFYDLQELGVGNYFWNCIVADIESLIVYADSFQKAWPVPNVCQKLSICDLLRSG
ncbi:hypothetical protein [Desulfosarcina variabilis]|uniref:hypothetical protein n=1 Tax=Desulfosarcina variabilis TaxID=2300 RepID=UPI003AFB06DF